jgi:hypothetical protein
MGIMTKYPDRSGRSGVSHYAIGKDFIQIRFITKPTVYIYSYDINGREHIEIMKKLALAGEGLSTYISEHPEVRDHFERK